MKAKHILLVAGSVATLSAADFQVSGSNELRAALDSINEPEPSRYFQEWFDLNASMGNFSVDLGFEAQIAPFPGSFSPADSIGMMKRTFRWNGDNITVEAGHFFTTLGNGITLRSYEDRDLGWNTNIDGLAVSFAGEKVEGSLFGGKMRDFEGVRHALLEGAKIRLAPGKTFFPGATGVIVQKDSSTHYWGSITGELYFPAVTFKGEFAAKDFGKAGAGFSVPTMFKDWDNFLVHGRAAYLNTTVTAGSFTLFAEGKNYRKFSLKDDKLQINTPPAAIKEHLFSLFTDMTPTEFKGDNEQGFLTELSGPLPGENMFSLSYSNTRSQDSTKTLLFSELYGQTDLHFGELKTTFGGGFQNDQAGRYINAGIHGEVPIKAIAVKADFAHQHRTLDQNFDPSRQYFFQTYELGISWKQFVFSALGAATSDPDRKESGDGLVTQAWGGGQFNMTIKEKHRLQIFGGTRKEGKICAGGTCVKKPELKGIELTFISSF